MNSNELKDLLANATPGPWAIDHSYQWPGKVRAENSRFVCNADPYTSKEPHGGIKQNRSNARLIALAPQLAADNIALKEEVERLRIRARELVAYSERLEREAEMNAEDSEKVDAENAKLRATLELIYEDTDDCTIGIMASNALN